MLTLAFRFYFADAPTTRQNAPKIVFTVQTIFILPDPEKRRRNDSVRSFSRQVQSVSRVSDTDGLFLAFYVKVYAYFVIERMKRTKFAECVSNPLTYDNKNCIIENRNSTLLFWNGNRQHVHRQMNRTA